MKTIHKLLPVLCFALSMLASCDVAEEIKNVEDCNKKGETYNTASKAFSDYLGSTEFEKADSLDCDQYSSLWNSYSNSYRALCAESRTAKIDTAYTQATVASALLVGFSSCDLEFDDNAELKPKK